MNKLTKKQILSFLQASFPRSFKTKELARQLGLPKQGEGYDALKNLLRSMFEDGMITRLEGRKWGAEPVDALVTGDLAITEKGFGVVTTREVPPREIYVSMSKLNDAVHGAEVEVEISPVSRGRRPEGRIVRQIRVPVQRITGTVHRIRDRYFVKPDGKGGGPDVFLERSAKHGVRDGDKVHVELDGPAQPGHPAHGKVMEVLGRAGRQDVEMLALARRYQLTPVFPDEVEREARSIPDAIPAEEIARRLDLRDTVCFTIDPDNAKDFDDAVSIARTPEGNYLLGVHIADVSHFVRPGSALDEEAERRGTSVYMMDTVIPMFPERLSNELCSLKEGVDRLTCSVLMTVTPRGAVVESTFHKSVIRSRKRFTYTEAENVIATGAGPYADELGRMNALATVLTRKRHREGSVDFDVPEVRFIYDETGRPVDIIAVERLQSMRLIEEFMLLANRTVAARFKGTGKTDARKPFIFRVHDAPDPEKVTELVDFLTHLGIRVPIDPKSSKSFQHLLELVENRPEKNVIHDVTIRSMAKAVYSEKNIGHFGLSFPHYTHFTSPIRRYPDCIVHRLLFEPGSMAGGAGGSLADRLARIAQHSSAMERLAMEAEREALKIKQVDFMKKHLGDELHGVISGVTQFGMFIKVVPSLVEGLIHVKEMNDDYYVFDARKRSLIGQRHGRRYRLGDAVDVLVVRVDGEAHRIDFQLRK